MQANRNHRIIGGLIALALMATMAGSHAIHAAENERGEDSKAQKPDVLAVDFYADWCGFCQQMKEARAEVRELHAEDAVLFLTLDHTDDKSTKQAEFLAMMLGMDDIWEEYGGRTGRMLLIDPNTWEVMAELTHEHDTNDISEAIAANLGN